MIQYRAEDGLVSVIADDILSIQEAVYKNIADRLGVIIKNTGIKGDSVNSFDLSVLYISGDLFEVTLSNIGPVIFGDYLYITDTEDVLSIQGTITANETKYVYLKRVIQYNNDQEDNFKLGHPVDEEGSPPVSGYNIESEYILELDVCLSTSLPTEQIVILATITREGSTSSTTTFDVRNDNAVTLHDFGLIRGNDIKVSDLQIKPLYQTSIISSIGQADIDVNQIPSSINMTVNRLFLDISWSPVDDVCCYQLRLQILDSFDTLVLKPTYILIPDEEGVDRIRTYCKVAEGVKYQVSVRTLSSNLNHDPGPWISTDVLAGAPDEVDPVPAPELSVASIQGSSSIPRLVEIFATPAESTPAPYYVQIFKTTSLIQGVSGDAVLIYEGTAPSFKYTIPEEESIYFAARVVSAGGICSPMTYTTEKYDGGTLGELMPEEFVVIIPLAKSIDKDDPLPFRLASFPPPSPYSRLRKIEFQSAGSVLISTTVPEDTLNCELIVGVEGTFPFLDGESNGKMGYTEGKVCWNAFGSGTNTIPARTLSATVNLTTEEYMQLNPNTFISLGEGVNRGGEPLDINDHPVIWTDEEEIKIWFTMYDWKYADRKIVIAGTLHLTFDKLSELEE